MSDTKAKKTTIFSYYKPYKGLLALDLLFATVGAGVTLVIPLIVRYITNQVIYEESAEAWHTIVGLSILMLGLLVLELVCNFYITYWGHMMGARMEYGMRNEIFEHYQKLSFTFYDNQKVGQLMSRVTNDLFDITELLHHGPEDILISLIKIVGALVILCRINGALTLTVACFLPFIFCFALFLNRKMKHAYRQNRVKMADINGQIEDNLSGIRVVKSFANEEIEMEKFRQGNDRFLATKRNSYLYMGTYNSVLNAMLTAVTIAVVLVGARLITTGSMQVTDLITFLLYVANFTEPVKKLINFTEQFQNGYSGYTRFREIMDIEPDIADKKDAAPLKDVKGDVEFRDVSFRYEANTDKVLDHVSLHVPAGSYVALAGSSGGGKTTLCSLIPRFYDVTSGSVCIDGRDVRDVTLKSLRENIGIVQQDVYLFAGTVMDNILYGKPDATREEVIEAAKNANAHDFIMELPEGYDTDIGQRGVKLSGGQKQRISIARVFLKNPPILIFDEATSALDNESERVVQESLERLAKERTTFVIAHRLSTIRNAQKILVLTENGIEEQGTHEELLALHGVYEKLYQIR
ncbi:thiamine ABC transporter permease [Lachnoclostridium sp. An131]|uniref:ABC transporter ATP-binding protein n=1 Tax=Lachnoclostridium sp. An131 TaxID=1965555 RepID=UPI000B3A17AA|nr:ABC transporter ATP-binding protein [Lachnoclostridium sp. An131]OUQ26625.1 thiamine ABC transporter permease [Lachnoclostridium sp. An131]